ncbi:MAG: adenylosuccinate lyase family protein [Thiothrix sp.]|nr:adenylosuccinate lyase family protein [Thiothrix sp.]
MKPEFSASAVSLLDNPLWGRSFADDEMRGIMSAAAYLDACKRTEVALARAQARLGIVPKEVAEGIAGAAEGLDLDMDRMAHETEIVGYPILPLVEQMSAAAGEAGRYLHWGATTQDIMDTATILQLAGALDLIERRLKDVRATLAGLAHAHRDTPMAGRTHLQHALPVTFGWKAAVWLSAFDRHLERLGQLRPRLLVVEFSGASGTLASLGADGLDVQRELAAELGLGVPSITWHSMRDSIAEAVSLLAMIGGSLGKIATDISIMMTTELGEVSEPFVRHRGASSTMPQKQNPVSCELLLASARLLRNHAATMYDALLHDFERATGPWHLEWSAVPEAFSMASGALAQAQFMLGGLVVHPDAMARNLNHSRGLIVAEAVMMALAPHTGRVAAHDLVYGACRQAIANDQSLYDVLIDVAEVVGPLGKDRVRELTTPANYLGTAPAMVDRLLIR